MPQFRLLRILGNTEIILQDGETGLHRRFLFLDATRGLAALAVLLLHFLDAVGYSYLVPNANIAVDFFFILSGFVVAAAYEGRRRRGELSFKHFLILRFIRLYPLFAIGMTIGLTVGILRLFVMPGIPASEVATAFVLGLLVIPSREWFGTTGLFPLNNPAWSLFFEVLSNVVFIVFVPFIRTFQLAVCVVLFAAALFWTGYLHGPLGGDTLDEFTTGLIRVGFGFGAGVLIWRSRLHTRFTLGALWSLPLAVVLLVILLAPIHGNAGLVQPIMVVTLLPAVMILSSAVDMPGRAAGICEALGRLSYPLYIVHYPFVIVTGALARAQPTETRSLLVALAGAIIVIAFAALLIPIDERLRGWLSAQAWANRFRTSTAT